MYSVPALLTTAWYRLTPPEPPPLLVEASSVAPVKSQLVYFACDSISQTLWELL